MIFINSNEQSLIIGISFHVFKSSKITDKVGRFGVDSEIAEFQMVAFFLQRHVEIVANLPSVQDRRSVQVEVIIDQNATATENRIAIIIVSWWN